MNATGKITDSLDREQNERYRGIPGMDPNDPATARDAASRFLADCGLPLVPDAVDQLAEAFLPALRIICERGYHPEGNTWREAGWRGLLTDIKKKSNRLWYRSWVKGGFDADSSMDLINFCGFYYRLRNVGKEWGSWGPPGSKLQAELHEEDAEAVAREWVNRRPVKDNPQALWNGTPARMPSTSS